MNKIFALIPIAVLVLLSCSKNEKEPASKTELLTASPWFHMRSTSLVGGVLSEAPYSSYDICVKDDPYKFNTDGRLLGDQGVLRCSGEPDYEREGSWAFKDEETTLAIELGGWADWQIVKLTQDSLVIKLTNNDGVSTNYYAHSF